MHFHNDIGNHYAYYHFYYKWIVDKKQSRFPLFIYKKNEFAFALTKSANRLGKNNQRIFNDFCSIFTRRPFLRNFYAD